MKLKVKAYIAENYTNLDLIKIYNVLFSTTPRELAEQSVRQVIEELCLDENENVSEWASKMKDNKYQILNNPQCHAYWSLRRKAEAEAEGIAALQLKAIESVSSTLVSSSSLDTEQLTIKPSIEQDKIYFGGESPATIIKKQGIKLLNDNTPGFVRNLCLNSILDLADNSQHSQRQFFTDQEWDLLKRKFLKMKRSKLTKDIETCIDVINKGFKSLNLRKALWRARKQEHENQGDVSTVAAIYCQLINVYMNHAYLFEDDESLTEADWLAKLWMPIFEALFAGSHVRLKWGESALPCSTILKKQAQDDKHVIGLKIDCRFMANSIDVGTAEAARNMTPQKITSDHAKLLVEAKLILDTFATRLPLLPAGDLKVYCVQICRQYADILCLDLVDNGLYVATPFARLSLPSSLVLFTSMAKDWFDSALQLKKRCLDLEKHTHIFSKGKKRSFGDHFDRPVAFEPNAKRSWIRGTFFESVPIEKQRDLANYLYAPPPMQDLHTKKKNQNIHTLSTPRSSP
ncbi:hypothetical protein DM01DRAFT_1411273 [Hesseltinella vesiculosa]|uniref:Uncharacterized protein n=1 Tax=Hesseltinella vesiculosa TaxID=101127 RepID=A0A1X2G4C4_9FUNG|nr:hypothetical protein DM01DRAFT_1411273 [Hesseltinella vesiculosa]